MLLILLLCGCAAKTPASDNSENSAAAGSGWPSDTVTLYVPASAGGGTDVSARAIASRLAR